MGHGVAWRIQGQEFYGFTDLNNIPCRQPDVHTGDFIYGIVMSQQFCPGRRDYFFVATCVVPVFVGVHYLSDCPALVAGFAQALFMIQRIDCQGFPSLRADNEVVKITVGVAGPDLFNDHYVSPGEFKQNGFESSHFYNELAMLYCILFTKIVATIEAYRLIFNPNFTKIAIIILPMFLLSRKRGI
jgi:hypothetical protein